MMNTRENSTSGAPECLTPSPEATDVADWVWLRLESLAAEWPTVNSAPQQSAEGDTLLMTHPEGTVMTRAAGFQKGECQDQEGRRYVWFLDVCPRATFEEQQARITELEAELRALRVRAK